MRDPSELLDLDIWLAERADGRICAYTHAEPRFLAVGRSLGEVVAETRWTLGHYATACGHDVALGLEPSYRPAGHDVPAEALPIPCEGGARLTGRLVVRDLRADGRAPSADLLAGFLARASAARGAAPGRPARRRAP